MTINRLFFAVAICLSARFAMAEQSEQICRYCQQAHETLANTHSLATSTDASGRNYAPTRQVDVLHIKLDVTPDYKKNTVAGTASITFKPISKPVTDLRLDAVDLTIKETRVSEGEIEDHTSTDEDLTIVFTEPIPVDQETTIEIDYEAQPTKGLYFRTPEMGYPETNTHCWTQGEPHEARHWFPCFDYPNERSTTEVICHVPDDMTVLSNGELIGEETDANTDLKSVHWKHNRPHANYLICLVAGYFEKLEKKHRDVPLAFYTQPNLIEHAPNSFEDTDSIMAFFEKEIGVDYPWNKYYQVTISDFMWGGMENTTITTLTHNTIFAKESENIHTTRRLDAHEMAHQWFGDYVTCKDWSHLWLNEGFATYYTHLYEGHKFGPDAMLYGLYRDAQGRVLSQNKDTKPMVYRNYKSPKEQFDYRAYPKGSWILHMLRSQLGPDLYRKCIQTYLERHALSSVVTEDLNSVIEEVSGRSFDRFFDQWVYHARHPDLKVTYRWLPADKLARVTVEQTHKTSDDVMQFAFPTKIRFVVGGEEGDDKDDSQIVDHEIEIRDQRHEFYVPLDAEPTIVRFDPELTVLANVTFDKPDSLLLAQIENSDDMIGRLIATEQLGKKKTHKSVEALTKVLREDPFFGVRLAAANSLEKIHNDEAFTALSESLLQDDARVRRRVVENVAKFYRPETAELLQQITKSEKNPAILATTISGLGRFHQAASKETIERFLNTPSFRNELAGSAIQAIRKYDDESYIGPLMKTINKREAEFTSRGLGRAMDAVAFIARNRKKKDNVRKLLSRHLDHPKETVRIAAIRALGTLGDHQARGPLTALSESARSERVESTAKEALAKLDKKQPPFAPPEIVELRKMLEKLTNDNKQMRKELDELKAKKAAKDKDK